MSRLGRIKGMFDFVAWPCSLGEDGNLCGVLYQKSQHNLSQVQEAMLVACFLVVQFSCLSCCNDWEDDVSTSVAVSLDT